MSYQGPDANSQNQYMPVSQQQTNNIPNTNYTPVSQPSDPYNPSAYSPQAGPYNTNYQQPYTQSNSFPGATTPHISSNVLAALSYIFTWVGAIVALIIRKRDHFVSFHAMQSLIFFGALTILRIVLPVFYYSIDNPITDAILPILWNLVVLVGFVGWLVLSILAFQQKYVKLPIIGNFAQRYADKNAGPYTQI